MMVLFLAQGSFKRTEKIKYLHFWFPMFSLEKTHCKGS